MTPVAEKILGLVQQHLALDLDKVSLNSSISDDLGADSLDAITILMAIEDEFDIEVPDEATEGFVALGDVVRYVEQAIRPE